MRFEGVVAHIGTNEVELPFDLWVDEIQEDAA